MAGRCRRVSLDQTEGPKHPTHYYSRCYAEKPSTVDSGLWPATVGLYIRDYQLDEAQIKMERYRTTLIMLVLLVALGVTAFVLNNNGASTNATPTPEA